MKWLARLFVKYSDKALDARIEHHAMNYADRVYGLFQPGITKLVRDEVYKQLKELQMPEQFDDPQVGAGGSVMLHQPTGLYKATCACGWSISCGLREAAVEDLRKHLDMHRHGQQPSSFSLSE